MAAADGEKKKNHGYGKGTLFPISPGVCMTAKEIAEIADVSVMTVWNRYRDGIRGTDLLQKRKRRGTQMFEVVTCTICGREFMQDKSHLVDCPQCWKW